MTVSPRPDALRARRAGPALEAAAAVRARLDAARLAPLPGRGLTADRAEELVAEIRSDREVDALIDADRFVTNNTKDFGREIKEVDVTHPAHLSDP